MSLETVFELQVFVPITLHPSEKKSCRKVQTSRRHRFLPFSLTSLQTKSSWRVERDLKRKHKRSDLSKHLGQGAELGHCLPPKFIINSRGD